ncbi:hypothetical protein I7I50_08471 [Histoplasma capsulatum G186AR]|uniref:Uncharacterized protein n=1 Tax=Ajellomyces capsulatus TaxID=5037 RepID=A0A8H7YSW1_AJECA|nr:hypothetical protein I7I52_05986 [Histoplasma capsulatum]QSS73624.1 hypothetical protein I7I50_08471 [Histoplasma capsulatum G186AR]
MDLTFGTIFSAAWPIRQLASVRKACCLRSVKSLGERLALCCSEARLWHRILFFVSQSLDPSVLRMEKIYPMFPYHHPAFLLHRQSSWGRSTLSRCI